jgi:hypothetical protein
MQPVRRVHALVLRNKWTVANDHLIGTEAPRGMANHNGTGYSQRVAHK